LLRLLLRLLRLQPRLLLRSLLRLFLFAPNHFLSLRLHFLFLLV
jgi:hypothetical protein